jgi:sulfate permease, SulP family
MTLGDMEDDRLSGEVAGRSRALASGALIGLLTLVFTISFSAVLFTGPLEPFREYALAVGLASAIIFAAVGASSASSPGLWWTNQAAPVALMALGAGALQSAMPEAPTGVLLSTTLLFLTCSSLAAGLLMLLAGVARVGQLAKFVPYPVIGGFLAATGLFLVIRAAALALPADPRPDVGLYLEHWQAWSPHVAAGGLLALLSRRFPPALVLLAAIAVVIAGFWTWLAAKGITAAEARAAGLLFDGGLGAPLPLGSAWDARFAAPDFAALAAQWPFILAVTGLSFLGLLMNSSALELQADASRDLNRDLRTGGVANLLSGAAGGFVGYPSVSMAQFSQRIAPGPSRLGPLAGLALLVATSVGGMAATSLLPVALFVVMLAYVGIDILYRWLIAGYREMPALDYAIVLVILAVTLLSDFAAAILVGMIAATLRFAAAYSRVEVVRSGLTGRLRLSPVERSEADIEILTARGAETMVFELQGFLFFGTANGLYDRIVERIEGGSAQVRHLAIDFRRVEGMDISTAFVFTRLMRYARRKRIRLIYTHLKGSEIERLERSGALRGAAVRPTLQDGLAEIEDEMLRETSADDRAPPVLDALFTRAAAAGCPLARDSECLGAGQVVFAEGEASDSLIFLEEGRLSALIRRAGGEPVRVAGFLPGSVVGEIGFITDLPRTATVMSDTEVRLRRVDRDALHRVTEAAPEIAAEFHAHLARLLAKRLGRTTALFVAMDV